MTFVNNYSAWIVDSSTKNNMRITQNEIILILKKWEQISRAEFDVKKTFFIHLIRYREANRDVITLLWFKKKEILLTEKVKILKITFNKELQFKTHLTDKTNKVIKMTLTLHRLKRLKSKNIKQLIKSSVLLMIDYMSLIWYLLAI